MLITIVKHIRFFILFVIFHTFVARFHNGIQCQQYFLEEPKNTSVIIGNDVTLKCAIKNLKGMVVWCKEESFCTFGRNLSKFDSRIDITGDESKGEHHLLVKNASINDNTKYQCQVLATETTSPLKSSWAFLTVLIKPTSVKILTDKNEDENAPVQLTTNATSTIECQSENSNPECDFVWFLDGEKLKVGGEIISIKTTSTKLSSKLLKSSGKLQVKPLKTENWKSKSLKCLCQHDLDTPGVLKVHNSRPISINYSPILKILKTNDDELIEGKYVQFECISDATPPVTNYKWFIDDKVFSSGSEERFLNLKIENNMFNKLLKCEAKNQVSTQTTSYQMDVTYAPKFRKQLPSHKIVRLNELMQLHCDVDSNPSSSVYWTLNDTTIYTYPTLTIYSMKPENYGVYKCTASLKDFPKISSSSLVLPPGQPLVECEPIQYLSYGERGTIECMIEKEPKADSIEWFKSDGKIDVEKEVRYRLSNTEIENKGTKSVLIITEPYQEDFFNFTIRVANKHGFTLKTIKIEAKESQINNILPLTVIFLFVFIMSGIIVFFGYLKFFQNNLTNNHKNKKKMKYGGFDPRFMAKPSFMLNGPRSNLKRKTANRNSRDYLLHRLKKPTGYHHRVRYAANPGHVYTELVPSTSQIINPANFSQLNFSSHDFLNHPEYEYGIYNDQIYNSMPSLELFGDQHIYESYANLETAFQTDV